MKRIMKRLVTCALVLLMSNAAFGQKRKIGNSASKSATSATRAVCKGEPVPKGFVVVGYKSSEKCGENSEVVIKRPANTEMVCEGSPVPEGYHVVSQEGSTACRTADSNPLANALSIQKEKDSASPLGTLFVAEGMTTNEILRFCGRPRSQSVDSFGDQWWTYELSDGAQVETAIRGVRKNLRVHGSGAILRMHFENGLVSSWSLN